MKKKYVVKNNKIVAVHETYQDLDGAYEGCEFKILDCETNRVADEKEGVSIMRKLQSGDDFPKGDGIETEVEYDKRKFKEKYDTFSAEDLVKE